MTPQSILGGNLDRIIKAWFLVVQVGEGVHLCFLSGLIVEPLLSWVHAAGFERVGVIMWM